MRRLSRDFTLLIGALLIGSIVTFGAGLFGLTRLDGDLRSVVSVAVPRLMTITDLRRQIRVLVVAENDHILERDAAKAATIAGNIKTGSKAVADLFGKYERFLLPDDADKWAALRKDFEGWLEVNGRVLALSAEGKTPEATALSRTHSKQWEALIKALIGNAEKHLQSTTSETFRVSRTARITLVAVFAVSALLGVIAGLFIYRGIRRTVREVVSLKDRLLDANAGLERTVDERTRTIRAILDHVHFGFFLVDPELRITDGYTRSLAGLLGRDQLAGAAASDCLGFTGAAAVDFGLRVSQIFDDMLPEALTCDQVPERTVVGGRILRIQASAVRGPDGQVAQVLFGISDVTELDAAERTNRHNQTLLRALRAPDPFRQFVADLNHRFGAVRNAVETADEARARREIHTIKGNASCYGLTDLANRAHRVEEHPQIELPQVVDLEHEFESFLDANADVLGVGRDGAQREAYRIDGEDIAELEQLVRGARDIDSLRGDLLRRLSELRWQPVGQLLGPLDVQVRALGERLGKSVALRVVGGDTEVLASRVQPVMAVLSHLLRNAVDHGIELIGRRGDKPAQATLELAFADTGDGWQIAVRDDGRGIDGDALRARAVELGVITADAALRYDQLCELIFARRLSTASEVSDVSGRGEGMAAVADAVRQVGGRIAVRSQPGVGTAIAIDIPKVPPSRALSQPISRSRLIPLLGANA